ncbi:FAD-dependent monooxygenase [Geminicoccus flavidas]|uniref:FAD-dependent monooxygenase n=1 Tax=Geminicoccus flavidas TaxID=2506407 RepID=UPI00135B8E25|nr:FAD-dependent monooxygenase [Geminicoccus flavidas]
MVLPRDCEVLVVGAGPAGLSLAAELERQGASGVLLVDRLAEGSNLSRAAVIHARTLEVLEPLGVTAELLRAGHAVQVFRMREHDRLLATIPFDRLPSAYRCVLMCPQDRTEQILHQCLTARGGTVARPCRLVRLEQAPDQVLADLETDLGTQQVAARYVVGCDGGHSFVREAAGIDFVGGTYEESFVLADLHMDWPLGPDEASLMLSPDGLMVVVPFPGGRYRIVATMADAPAEPDLATAQALLDRRGPQQQRAVARDLVWSSRFRIHHRVAATFRKDRVLLCGDAAHVHSPAGGQGMNTGIQDAVSLARPLIAALRQGDTAGLDAWATARRHNAQRLVAMTDRITRIATVRSTPARLLRNLALQTVTRLPPLQRRIAFRLAELDLR